MSLRPTNRLPDLSWTSTCWPETCALRDKVQQEDPRDDHGASPPSVGRHEGSRLAKALVPQVPIDLIRGLTAPAGWWERRGAGRLVARAPFQYALSTRAGCECIAHVLEGITELHPELTNTSIDGISAFDMISRESMLRGLLEVEGGGAALPFVRVFHGSSSEHLWEDDEGTVHRIPQGEGRTGRCHDASVVCSWAARRFGGHPQADEPRRVSDGHDDVFMATPPARVGPMYAVVHEELYARCHPGHGKTKVWNQVGVRPVVASRSPASPTQKPWCGQVP